MTDGPATCIRHGKARALPRRHEPDCRNDDCRGCQPCPVRHCGVCGKEHLETEPRTCIGCLGRARNDLAYLPDLLVLSQDRLQDWWATASPGTPTDGGRSTETPIPGGDLLVMTGPGSRGLNALRRRLAGDRQALDDESPADPEVVVHELAQIEDHWRRELGHPAAPHEPNLTDVYKYLNEQAGRAAQQVDDFADFTRTVKRLRGQLAAALRDSDQPIHGVHCQDCPEVTLVRGLQSARPCAHQRPVFKRLSPMVELTDGTFRWRTPGEQRVHYLEHQKATTTYEAAHQSCDQGGFSEDWACPRCHRTYTRAEYGLAVRTQYDQRRADIDAKKTRLEAATTAYVASSNALITMQGHVVTTGALDTARYLEVVDAHNAARVGYAEALTASGYAVPVGLIPDEATT